MVHLGAQAGGREDNELQLDRCILSGTCFLLSLLPVSARLSNSTRNLSSSKQKKFQTLHAAMGIRQRVKGTMT